MTPPSVHDNLLISYEVHCEKRTISLRTEYRLKDKPTEFTNIIFEGVRAYHFQNDAFGNIIFGVENVPAEWFLERYGAEIVETNRMAGSPGEWVKDLDSAPAYLSEQEIQAFTLSSSLGLCGWVLAKKMLIVRIEPSDPSQSSREAVEVDRPAR